MLRKLTIIIVVCLFAHTAYTQATSCSAALPADCFQELSFTGTLPVNNSPPFEPNPATICPGGGTAHNNLWFRFAAGTPNITIQIDISNCTTINGPNGPLTGIQAGIYEDCPSGSTSVVCEPGCFDNQIILSSCLLYTSDAADE